MINKFLHLILLYLINHRSIITFTMVVNGKSEIIFVKRSLKHIPQVNSMVYFDDPNVTYQVVSVAHQITSGHKIFVGLERLEEKK